MTSFTRGTAAALLALFFLLASARQAHAKDDVRGGRPDRFRYEGDSFVRLTTGW